MLDSSYKFSRLNSKTDPDTGENIYLFKFSTEEKYVYNVDVRCKPNSLYEVAFFLSRYRGSNAAKKYGGLLNVRKPGKVLRTVVEIAHLIYQNIDPLSSFMFLGYPKEGEGIVQTKRYVLYSKIASDFFNPDTWRQDKAENASMLLIINPAQVAKSATLKQQLISSFDPSLFQE